MWARGFCFKSSSELIKWLIAGIRQMVQGESDTGTVVFHSWTIMVNPQGWQWITTLPELHIIFRKSRHLKQERELRENSWLRIIFHLRPFIWPDVQFAGCNSTREGSQGQIRGTDEHFGSSWRRRHFLNLEKNGLQWLKTDLGGTC